MKRLCTLVFALLPALLALGQKEAPPFGKIDKADLEMTSCDIEPEADLYTLVRTGEITFSMGSSILRQTVYRVRVKILSDKMVGKANIRLDYLSRDRIQAIGDVQGLTYNLDEGGNIVISKLAKSGIFSKDIDHNFSEVDFTLPDVKKGSVIEYTYTVTTNQFYAIDPWNFQDAFPTRFSQLSVTVPHFFDFTYSIHRTLPMDVNDDNSGAKVFTMENIPSLQEEPFMSAPKDYLQRVEFKLSSVTFPGQGERIFNTSWEKLNDDLVRQDNFGAQLHKSIPHTDDLDKQLAALGKEDSINRMNSVYNYVRQHMEHVEGASGRYSDEGVKDAWEAGKGGDGSINLLLVNLLRRAGLRAYPLLVSTRKHGAINIVNADLAQFNGTLAVVLIGDKKYVLNGADKFTPYGLIPYDVQCSKGFIVDREDYGWITLYDQDHPYMTTVLLNGTLTEKGMLKGSASIYNYGYSKVPRCRTLQDWGPARFKEAYYTRAYRDFHADSLRFSGQDVDTLPLDQELEFRTRLNSSGDYLFFSPTLFLGLEKNPFIAAHRFSDVDFGYAQHYTITGSLQLPDGFAFDTLPKNIRMIMPDTSIVLERMMQVDDNLLSYRIMVDIKRPIYVADEYDNFREFYKRLFATLNDPVVIRKKNQ